MDKDKMKKEFKKILEQKQLRNLIVVCLILGFVLIALNVLLPNSKNLNTNNILTPANSANSANSGNEQSLSKEEEKSYEEKQKTELTNILKKMNGVGDVEVMLSFENGEEKVPAYDKNTQKSITEESDNEGGKRVNTQNTDGSKVVMSTNDGNNEPIILKTYKPKIVGVIILAEGAGDSKIKYEIEQAVSKLYNLSSDKVNVYSMKK